jgi:anti-sigma regulatory factor (Ser/Thr protein kinase)
MVDQPPRLATPVASRTLASNLRRTRADAPARAVRWCAPTIPSEDVPRRVAPARDSRESIRASVGAVSVSHLVLQAHTPRQASEARDTLRRQLDRWHCGSINDGLLVFAELVTNAVQHAGGTDRVTVIHGAQVLRIEVHDHSHTTPDPRRPSGVGGGFGLSIVRKLSDTWGWEQTADGKVVWSDIPCCPHGTP